MTGRSPSARLPVVGAVVVLGSIMTVLDVTVANVAVDPLAADLAAPLVTVQWVSTAYTLALTSVMPCSGWAMDRYGTRRVYLACLAVFTLGSALAAVSPGIGELVAARVLQGLGGGMLVPTGTTMVMRAAGPGRIGLATRILGVPLLVAPLLGPVVGGVLVDAVSWRALFAVNVPIGVAAAVLAARGLPGGDRSAVRRPLDVGTLLLLSPGVALLVAGLVRSSTAGLDVGAAAAVAAGLLGVAGFLVRSRRVEHPLLDLVVLARRGVGAAVATGSLFACGYFGSLFLAPLYFQLVRGEPVAVSGLLLLPLGGCSALTMQFAGRVVDRVGASVVVRLGVPTAVVGLGAFVLQLRPDASFWGLGIALAVMGVGVGSTLMPAVAAANAELPSDEVPAVNTLVQVSSQTAAALGTAAVAVVLSVLLSTALPDAAPASGLSAARQVVDRGDAAALGGVVDAFRAAYTVGLALMAAAFLPALALARHRGERAQARPA